jgi:hypothetical protein
MRNIMMLAVLVLAVMSWEAKATVVQGVTHGNEFRAPSRRLLQQSDCFGNLVCKCINEATGAITKTENFQIPCAPSYDEAQLCADRGYGPGLPKCNGACKDCQVHGERLHSRQHPVMPKALLFFDPINCSRASAKCPVLI